MQLNSLTRDLYVCVGLAQHNILVAEDSLAVAHSPVVAEDSLAVVHSPVVVEGIPVAKDIPVVGTLEEASAALRSRIAAARVDLHWFRALLPVAVRGVVVLPVGRMAVPRCSYVSPSKVPGYRRQ